MKYIVVALTALAFVLAAVPVASAGDAIICKSDSTDKCKDRKYCCYPDGMSQSDGGKYCQKLGCKRGGTSSCPTAANVSSCGTRDKKIEKSD